MQQYTQYKNGKAPSNNSLSARRLQISLNLSGSNKKQIVLNKQNIRTQRIENYLGDLNTRLVTREHPQIFSCLTSFLNCAIAPIHNIIYAVAEKQMYNVHPRPQSPLVPQSSSNHPQSQQHFPSIQFPCELQSSSSFHINYLYYTYVTSFY